MRTTTWTRNGGFVSVVLFENGTSAAVSTKTFKTKAGAEKFNARIIDVCGDKYEKANLPFRTTDLATGEITINFKVESGVAI